MSKKQFKDETVKMIDAMIEHADKGVSGFWVEDGEGCGNPDIFPEFDEALKRRKLVVKNHMYCPWNTAIVYGSESGRGSISTGCYHSCSIRDARYLNTHMISAILNRYRKRLLSGEYDNVSTIRSLFTQSELDYIESQKLKERNKSEQEWEQERKNRKKKAAKLLGKFKDNEDVCGSIIGNYGTNYVTYEIDFRESIIKDVVGGKNLSYDEFLEAQINSIGKYRGDLKNCFYNYPMGFMGQIEKINSKNNKVCFERIFVSGMFPDSIMFDGKEDHVWMDRTGFEEYEVGDCVKFCADVRMYLKTGNGKQIDFGLFNPKGIEKIDKYDLPTDEELMAQAMSIIMCDTCYLNEHCNRTYCMLKK